MNDQPAQPPEKDSEIQLSYAEMKQLKLGDILEAEELRRKRAAFAAMMAARKKVHHLFGDERPPVKKTVSSQHDSITSRVPDLGAIKRYLAHGGK